MQSSPTNPGPPHLKIVARWFPRQISVPIEVLCAECGYNLKGLPLESKCPECGSAILRSVRLAEIRGQRVEAELLDVVLGPIAKSAGCSIDGMKFVFDALSLALARAARPRANRGRVVHVSAEDVCSAVRDHALAYFNDVAEAKELLGEWGVRKSEDVGAILFALADAGFVKASDEDSPHDFRGKFTLETLLAR